MRRLKELDTVNLKNIKTEFVIDENGYIKEPIFSSSIPPKQQKVIIDAFATMPQFTPETHDGKAVNARYQLIFSRQNTSHVPGDDFEFYFRKKIGTGMYSEFMLLTPGSITLSAASLLRAD